MNKTAIIVPVLNNLKFTKDFYSSFCANTSEECVLIVIDNNSTDGTGSFFESLQDKRIHYIKNKENVGVAASWNQGLEIAKEMIPQDGFFAIVNNDIEFLTPNWITEMQNILNKRQDVLYTSPRTCYEKGKPGPLRKIHFEQLLYGDRDDQYVVGCCFMIPRRALDIVGYFDEQFEMKFYEDLDYINRVLESGHKVLLTNKAMVFHVRGATSTITTGGAYNESKYKAKWGGTPFDILEKQPKKPKAIRHFSFGKEA